MCKEKNKKRIQKENKSHIKKRIEKKKKKHTSN